MALDLVHHRLELLLGVGAVGGHGDHGQGGALPQVVVIDLGDADVELLGRDP